MSWGWLDNQAGEVYTVYQFKEQMLHLFTEIDGFIDDSDVYIDAIILANTKAYHQAIQDEQNLSLLQKLLSSEKEKLRTFIKNQDTLSQFPSSTYALHKTSQLLKSQVRDVSTHLSNSKGATNFDSIAGQAKELDRLMNSMHNWIKIQYELKGLSIPMQPPPEVIKLPPVSPPINPQNVTQPHQAIPTSVFNNNQCYFRPNQQANNMHALLAIGLLVVLPLMMYGLYVLLQSRPKVKKHEVESKTQCTQLIDQAEKLIRLIQDFELKNTCTLDYQSFINSFKELKKQGPKNNYPITELTKLVDDLHYFYKTSCQPNNDIAVAHSSAGFCQ